MCCLSGAAAAHVVLCASLQAAVLQQRVTGLMYCFDTWCKWLEDTATRLKAKQEEKLKASKEDKPGGKGAKDSRDSQQSKDLKAELDLVGLSPCT